MTGVGERLHDERRRKFWKLVSALAAAGAIGGFVFGFAVGYTEAGDHPLSPTLRLAATAAVLLSVAGGAYFSWRFFRTVDEVEVVDNLWGSLIGFYVYAFLFPAWWALHWLEAAPEPNDWIIFAAAIVSATAAYGVRKWRSR
jgi:Kef-type K+ transport system membrane component KefB